MELAKDCTIHLFDLLNSNDRIGIVSFESAAHIVIPIQPLPNESGLTNFKKQIRQLATMGGTDFECGIRTAGEEALKFAAKSDPLEYETRIVILTDDMPNMGATDSSSLGVRS